MLLLAMPPAATRAFTLPTPYLGTLGRPGRPAVLSAFAAHAMPTAFVPSTFANCYLVIQPPLLAWSAPIGAALADPAQVAKAATTNDASKVFFIGRFLFVTDAEQRLLEPLSSNKRQWVFPESGLRLMDALLKRRPSGFLSRLVTLGGASLAPAQGNA
jgi:hypothetical protein